MKKIKSLLTGIVFALALMAGCVAAPATVAQAAEENVNVVYATVPAEWENPCVWAWNADGVSAFEAWPGEAMTADPNNEGWYYIYVPEGMSSVIINANEGTVQTSDMSTDNKDAWVTVKSAEEATITNEQLTKGEIPAYVPTFTVYAKVDESWIEPCLWAWSAPDGTNVFPNWPGEAMKANANGYYSIKIPTWVNSIIVNGNAGTVQTSDMSIEAQTLWAVVDAEGGCEIFYEEPAASAEDMITVHATVPSDWLLPSLWAWSAPDGTNVFANWPGEELVLEGDWYTYQIPNWVNSVIVNGNLGTVQTADISIETGKDIWLVVDSADSYQLFYEEPDLANLAAPAETPAAVEETKGSVIESSVIESTPAATEAPVEEAKSNTAVIIVIVLAVVAAICGGVVVYKKKKN